MMTSRVPLHRPGGKSGPWLTLQSWQGMLFAVWGISVLLLGILEINDRKQDWHSPFWILPVLSIPVIWLCWIDYRKELAQYRAQLDQFTLQRVYCSATIGGWCACSQDAIQVIAYPNSIKTLPKDQIDQVYWGEPNGRISRLSGRVVPSSLVTTLGKDFPAYWVLLWCDENPTSSVVLPFDNEKLMKQWVEVAKSLQSGSMLPELELFAEPPFKSLRQKAGLSGRMQITCLVGFLLVASFGLHYYRIFSILFVAGMGMPNFGNSGTSKRLSVSLGIYRLEAMLAGLIGPVSKPIRPLIVGNRLIVCSFLMVSQPWTDSFDLSEIEKIELEDWGFPWYSRNLPDLFRKDIPSRDLVIRLILKQENDREREIKLPAEEAKALYEDLMNRIAKVPTAGLRPGN